MVQKPCADFPWKKFLLYVCTYNFTERTYTLYVRTYTVNVHIRLRANVEKNFFQLDVPQGFRTVGGLPYDLSLLA